MIHLPVKYLNRDVRLVLAYSGAGVGPQWKINVNKAMNTEKIVEEDTID